MLSFCLFFHIHQPLRIKPYSVFEIGKHTPYFDQAETRRVLAHSSKSSYDPGLKVLEKLILTHGKNFKVSISVSGIALEQLETWQPQILERLKRLAKTGSVEFLAETYYHSFAFEYSRPEFLRQCKLHAEKISDLFGQQPTVFKNTELLFHNPMAYFLKQAGMQGIITEGAHHILHGERPNLLSHAVHLPDVSLLLRNGDLSDDIGQRFSQQDWEHYPLTGNSFVDLAQNQGGDLVCVGMDLRQLGEFHAAETGIFDFLTDFPGKWLERGHAFKLPTEIIQEKRPGISRDVPYPVSWAGEGKDNHFAFGNSRQKEALRKIYEMESMVMESNNPDLLQTWSYLQTSDHFRNMEKRTGIHGNEGEDQVSPDQAYMHFMNLVADFQITLREL